MATKKINQFDSITVQTDTDLYEVSQSPYTPGTSKKETRAQMLTYNNANIQLPSSAKVTGLDAALALKAPIASPTFTGTVGLDTLVGAMTDLRINPSASGGYIYLGHDLASVFVHIGAGSAAIDFLIRNIASILFHVTNAGAVTTKNNTLDDGSGGANFTGLITGSISGNAATVTINAPLTGPVTSVGNATTIVALAITNAMLAGLITAAKLVLSDIVLAQSQVTNLVSDLATKPGLSSNNAFTGKNSFQNTILEYKEAFVVNASFSLTPAAILSKIVYVPTQIGAPVSMDWNTASGLIAAMTNPIVGSTISLKIVNPNPYIATMTNTTDQIHVITVGLVGGDTVIIPPGGELDVDILISGISTPQIAIFGAPTFGYGMPPVTLTSSQTISSLAFGSLVIVNSASAVTITLPQQSTLATRVGASFKIENIGAGDVTLAKEGSETLTGNSLLATGATAEIFRDATTNWHVAGGTSVLIGSASFSVGTVGDNTYSMEKLPFPGTITNLSSICRSGTCTATFKINSTTIAATANSVSTTSQTQSASGNNTFVAGDYFNVTISSNSTCLDMNLNVDFTYRINI